MQRATSGRAMAGGPFLPHTAYCQGVSWRVSGQAMGVCHTSSSLAARQPSLLLGGVLLLLEWHSRQKCSSACEHNADRNHCQLALRDAWQAAVQGCAERSEQELRAARWQGMRARNRADASAAGKARIAVKVHARTRAGDPSTHLCVAHEAPDGRG